MDASALTLFALVKDNPDSIVKLYELRRYYGTVQMGVFFGFLLLTVIAVCITKPWK